MQFHTRISWLNWKVRRVSVGTKYCTISLSRRDKAKPGSIIDNLTANVQHQASRPPPTSTPARSPSPPSGRSSSPRRHPSRTHSRTSGSLLRRNRQELRMLSAKFSDWWSTQVAVLVMITGLEEGGKLKAHQYWPEEGEPLQLANNITVELLSSSYQGTFYERWVIFIELH